ncbi:hypothetical protein EDB81DRAFT_772586 [Dactylonectria macrodidyma]|uniref:Zn(2)-C6 fungal-type domain-containing protein n=1 Tax=Dactylonectria macrodidyma TaxID=307937 RepID=A0A9P9JJ89_9HYPO|nr:hypothetical protein EDB81DRAFT_772586 [Dactylonectria macrodidyma]
MVYPGTRSSGCGLCRKRKIKCDERRPGCRRCEQHMSQCPGYDRPLEIRFCLGPHGKRFSEPMAEASSPMEPAAPTSSRPLSTTTQTADMQAEAVNDSELTPPSTLRVISTWDEESVIYFLTEYSVSPLPGMYSGHLDFLPSLVMSSSSASPLRPATRASAYLALSRYYKSQELYNRARRCYGVTLRSVNAILSQAPETWQDDTVAAIMLLHYFEDMDGEVFSNRAAHLRGIAGLYKVRRQSLLSKLPGCSLYSWAFSQLQIHAFITRTSYECLTIPAPEPDVNHPPTGMTVTVAKVGRFWYSLAERLAVIRLDPGSHHQRRLLLSSMHEAMRIQMDMGAWETSLPAPWKPRRTVGNGGRLLVTYSNRWWGTIWMMYHAVQIIFYHGVLQCCQSLLTLKVDDNGFSRELIQSSMAMAKRNIAQLTKLVCGSIRCLLGEVDANGQALSVPDYKGSICYNLVWPLVLVARSNWSTEDQVQLCKGTLTQIRTMYGINLAESAQGVATLLLS